jgi:hypothetical protein
MSIGSRWFRPRIFYKFRFWPFFDASALLSFVFEFGARHSRGWVKTAIAMPDFPMQRAAPTDLADRNSWRYMIFHILTSMPSSRGRKASRSCESRRKKRDSGSNRVLPK